MVLFSLFQGNQSNRYVLLNSKVVDYINFILRAAEFKNCSTEKVNNLSIINRGHLYCVLVNCANIVKL